uniref:MLO-like protein n=1 Tax=Oryza glumipatula TaxID=40148 RepID=A0A0D9ZL99_9ORYZ
MAAATIEDTPTWVVAAVCSAIVLISFAFERSLHYLGKALERRRRTLYEAFLKLKEELMLLGFISLLLVVFQDLIQRICIAESLMGHWLPCRGDGKASSHSRHGIAASSAAIVSGAGARRLLGEGTAGSGHCSSKGKVPLLSLHAIEQIHIFIFVLAITHVVLSAVTVLLGLLQMRRWRHWENAIKADGDFGPKMINRVQQFKFIQDRYKGFDKVTMVIIWMRSFFKQFYGSVTKDDYTAMRLGFVMEHFRGHPKFNFYDYMIKALEKDYKRVVGIKWYLWIFVMIFLLLNITGWHSYFWISLIPLVLLLLIGTKLEHIITQLAYEVATKHTAVEGDIAVSPSDNLFWLHSPRLATFGFNSCIMDRLPYRVSRIVICVVVQVLCSYSTLPLYAISAVFSDDVANGLREWADEAQRRTRRAAAGAGCLGGAAATAAGSSRREGIDIQNV